MSIRKYSKFLLQSQSLKETRERKTKNAHKRYKLLKLSTASCLHIRSVVKRFRNKLTEMKPIEFH